MVTESGRSESTTANGDEPVFIKKNDLIANNKELLDQLKQATDSELTQPLPNEDNEERKTSNSNTGVFETSDEDQPQIVVEEGTEELEETVNVIAKDRSYMLSYLVAKQKDEESGGQGNFKRTSERIRTQFLSKLVY